MTFRKIFVGSPDHLWRTLHFGVWPPVERAVRSIL